MLLGESLHPLACNDQHAKRSKEINPDSHRGNFARDRDRILYSRCFRRLAHKTQVYLTSEGKEHARTRLTHTLEVTQVARAIARALRMNEDLVEAIALGHDVGHSPFGHAGEQQLQRYLQNDHRPPRHMLQRLQGTEVNIPKSDFKHNFQSVRLLSALERYDSDIGLNLTDQCLEGMLKHTRVKTRGINSRQYSYPDRQGVFARLLEVLDHSTIESQIVAIADELSQVAHDLADAVLYRQIDFAELQKQSQIAAILKGTEKGQNLLNYYGNNPREFATLAGHLASTLISHFVDASIRSGLERLGVRETGNTPQLWQSHVPDPVDDFQSLKAYKDQLVVNCYDVNRMDNKGTFILRQLIDAYVSDPRQLPDAAFNRYRNAVKGVRTIDDWKKLEASFDIEFRLSGDEMEAFQKSISSTEGGALRQLPAGILLKLPYHLLFDEDWRRTIADQVAMMTDSNAEREFQLLYGSGLR